MYDILKFMQQYFVSKYKFYLINYSLVKKIDIS